MYSLWSNPLPSDEYTTKQAVVYYYEGKWVPIMLVDFTQALSLYKNMTLEGWKVFIFPTNCHPNKLGLKGESFSPVEASRVVSREVSPAIR